MMDETSVRKLKYIFFSHSVQLSSRVDAIERRTLGDHIISDKRFRLLKHISNARHSSKFPVLGEKKHIERKLLPSRTLLDHLESIKIRRATV